ncbi:MAG: tRNA preQ1(34) S-adenosylmethionine ribosyltransferase-isomerase QueA [Patescibacteria group bacterium]|jgi:S-adenosylmethionine:tRNA ribosyltransferase-isomerase
MNQDKLSDYDFDLPEDLIATHPAEPRDHSRLLVLNKITGEIEHKHFYDIVDYLSSGDILVLNNSKVIPARLMAVKESTGGKVEVLLHKKLDENIWQCLLGGRAQECLELKFTEEFKAKILKNNHDGTWDIRFNKSGADLMKAVEEFGEMPLPPYILQQLKIKNEKLKKEETKKSYQTVYADSQKSGSVAAPTAGLHFTPELLEKIKNKGVKILEITLYVGMGTFAPVKTEDISKHKMHAEWVEIDNKTINLIAKQKGGKIIAVGTTSVRSLESCWNNLSELSNDFKFWVDIFITPGYKFKIVDAMITNFHLPKSTLLMLVSALVGKEKIDKAYKEAIKKKYRFYSYGDAMLIK